MKLGMSRTYKDRPARIKYPEFHQKSFNQYDTVPYIASVIHWRTKEPYERLAWYIIKRPYVKLKLPRHQNTEWRWGGGTPSWWTNMFMNRPQRVASKKWERRVVNEPLWGVYGDYIEEPPHVGDKPHIYYW